TGILQANGELAVEPVMAAADVARTVLHAAEPGPKRSRGRARRRGA
ncbi:hypothetical protein JHN51_34345, partial [Streptomyces sp. MBT61]|nr:hypothetical protein [Streptomyces sp. MBT61]